MATLLRANNSSFNSSSYDSFDFSSEQYWPTSNDKDAAFASHTARLVSLLTFYYFFERGLRGFVSRKFPDFYAQLALSPKYRVFFGFLVGFFVISATAPSCLMATFDAWQDEYNGPWALRGNAKICVTARSILWVSELNRLELYTVYVYHHLLALMGVALTLHYRWPPFIMLSIFTSLISELPGMIAYMASAYWDSLPENKRDPRLEKFILAMRKINIPQYGFLRGSAIFMSLFKIIPDFEFGRLDHTLGVTILVLFGAYWTWFVIKKTGPKPSKSISKLSAKTD